MVMEEIMKITDMKTKSILRMDDGITSAICKIKLENLTNP
jgi:hypothetical protein